MRPLRLELQGFAAFKEPAVLDFEGLDLVAFTGPTGAGKSSLIDAMTFALYGSVARYNDARKVAPVIHQLSAEARVRLDFESAGIRYAVTRVVRRQNSSKTSKRAPSASTKEARLERFDQDSGTVLAGTVGELDKAIPELLGLDFDQFTRTIVLPQGEFANFLREDQASRDKLLQRLLDLGIYEQMGQTARSRARRAADQIEVYEDRRRRNPPPSAAEVRAAVDLVRDLKDLRDWVTGKLAELNELDEALDPLRQQVNEIDAGIARLEEMELPTGLDKLGAEMARLAEARSAASSALSEARARRDAAIEALEALPARSVLSEMQSVLEQLSQTEQLRTDREAELATVSPRIGELSVESNALEAEVQQGERLLRRARLDADAASWTASLEVGQACPVCRQEVAAIPDHDASAELAQIEQRLTSANQRLKKVTRELAQLHERHNGISAELERSAERIEQLKSQRAQWNEPMDARSIADALAAASEAERAEAAAGKHLRHVEKEHERIDAEADRFQATVDGHRQTLARARDSVAHLEPPVFGYASVPEDLNLLISWRDQRLDTDRQRRDEIAKRGKVLAEQRREHVASLSQRSQRFGIEARPEALLTAVAEAAARAEANLESAQRLQHENRQDLAVIAELQAQRVVDEELGRHLRAGKFTSWLLAEAVDVIVDKASVWLLELSNNQYSLLAGDSSFAIVDHHNADQDRDVRTLSGGETFLASLALALALADSVAELAPIDAPGLDSMFLDEGFGTLDPATLDVVATAIEELASNGRMIGVVTHVADLADRMPARFRVSKGLTTSSVELVET